MARRFTKKQMKYSIVIFALLVIITGTTVALILYFKHKSSSSSSPISSPTSPPIIPPAHINNYIFPSKPSISTNVINNSTMLSFGLMFKQTAPISIPGVLSSLSLVLNADNHGFPILKGALHCF
jgi:hypothetical protein